MAGKGYVPTIMEIDALFNKGDIEALRDLNETLGKRANERLKSLEKAGLDNTAAYNRAVYYIQNESEYATSDRFSRSRQMDIDELRLNIKEEAKFLRSQTSSIRGEKARRDKIFETMTKPKYDDSGKKVRDALIDIPEGENVDSFKKTFLEFLSDDAWSEIKNKLYSANIFNEAGEAISAGASIDDLSEAIENYRNGRTDDDILTIWDNWVSAGR